ncbi:MAG: Gfo/Idh/MocA family oxidoreductase [Armatimonadetes bacterium]|nr:Gfo/Idh/MocA family oxidoreductase [Armatimonadota bacterium]
MGKKTLNVGLIGYQFMGKAHSNAYRQANRFFDLPVQIGMKTICGRTESGVKAAAETFGWDGYETDWRKVVADPEIDIVDVATPGNSHCEIACAAAEAGKIVFCEKPIGNTLAEAKTILDAVKKAGVQSAVFHNYRKAPAVALAKRMIDDGKIGTIYHMRATYLQDWIMDPEFPLVWRLQKDVAGSGSHGDLNSHLIDTARYLVGEFDEVSAHMETFIKERPLVGEVDDKLGATASDKKGEVTVDDAAMLLARFKNGALGTFEATRFATGRKNHMRWEINGSKGALVFNLERMNELEFYDASDPSDCRGFRVIQATEANHPYAGRYWPVAHIIGYEHTFVNLVADAVQAIHEGVPISPDMEDGYQNQRVLDAVERSHESRSWVSL